MQRLDFGFGLNGRGEDPPLSRASWSTWPLALIRKSGTECSFTSSLMAGPKGSTRHCRPAANEAGNRASPGALALLLQSHLPPGSSYHRLIVENHRCVSADLSLARTQSL